jgi:UDP-glucose 4-epimerase
MVILVTGGAGYLGSHTCVELLHAGYNVIVVDILSNSNLEAIHRVEEITGTSLKFYELDLLDRQALERIFEENTVDAVVHFAAMKAVGESVASPLRYDHNNVTGSIILFEVMEKYQVKKLGFSSSATVYGMTEVVPISEDFPLKATNPYGRSKIMVEDMLRDLYVSDSSWSISILRYFNPIGAHESGRIGENPYGIPNNLIPYITQVAVGKLPHLQVFGDDYETEDGTGVRDVVDLANGHLKALEKLESDGGVEAYNLGTGKGYSVLEMIQAFEQVSGKEIPYMVVNRRPGGIAECYADPTKAERELGWRAVRELEEMYRDSWRWRAGNPGGYGK